MTYELKNDFLALQVSSRGAEITSMYASDGRQIIWHGDSRYWERHAPLLFPCVGGNWEGIIRVDGIQYPLCKHGFVQDMEFSLIQSTAESLSLAVTDTPETLKSFPFPFRLIVTYTLCGSRLDVAWTVENPAEREMPFLIGAHPAFLLPAFNPADAVHGYLRFPEVDTLVSTPTLRCDTILDIRGRISQVELLDASRRPLLSVQFRMPVLAMWAPEDGCSPFVCIEPWCGLCDSEGYTGEFNQRPYINKVRARENWQCLYSICVE